MCIRLALKNASHGFIYISLHVLHHWRKRLARRYWVAWEAKQRPCTWKYGYEGTRLEDPVLDLCDPLFKSGFNRKSHMHRVLIAVAGVEKILDTAQAVANKGFLVKDPTRRD